jgi:5-methylcytosine-specific restriction endonuclease McrA
VSARDRRRLKRSIANRDGMNCFYCLTPFVSLADATFDHLIPQRLLPGWQKFNLVLACYPCNQAKADKLPQQFLRQIILAARPVPWHKRLTHFLWARTAKREVPA